MSFSLKVPDNDVVERMECPSLDASCAARVYDRPEVRYYNAML